MKPQFAQNFFYLILIIPSLKGIHFFKKLLEDISIILTHFRIQHGLMVILNDLQGFVLSSIEDGLVYGKISGENGILMNIRNLDLLVDGNIS